MLLGVDEQLRRILIDAGHRLRVYVPYGEYWYAVLGADASAKTPKSPATP